MPLSSVAAAALVLAAAEAGAHDRPSEVDLFGDAPPTASAPAPAAAAPAAPPRADALKIGGVLYLRAAATWQDSVPTERWPVTTPNLLDAYVDVRPHDRARAFVLARTLIDPTGRSGSTGSSPGTTARPDVSVDQAWVRFDAGRAVFVTAGRQHVKWGTGHFWSPTDFLHPRPRDPLGAFDQRLGSTLVKLHVPWERLGWNFYGVTALEDPTRAGRFGSVGVGGRAEVVLGTAELGADALLRRGRDARFGLDASMGVSDFDVYGEVALRNGSDVALWRPSTGSGIPSVIPGYEGYFPSDFRPSATLGASWSHKYSDQDSVTLGAEGFFDSNGYDDKALYPVLLAQQSADGEPYFTIFHVGRAYAAVYAQLPKPGSWNDSTVSISTIANLSDTSFVSRVDYSVLLRTDVTLEAYVAAHYGAKGGELRLGAARSGPARPPVLDFGLALRVAM